MKMRLETRRQSERESVKDPKVEVPCKCEHRLLCPGHFDGDVTLPLRMRNRGAMPNSTNLRNSHVPSAPSNFYSVAEVLRFTETRSKRNESETR